MSVKQEFGSVQAPVTLFRGAVENPWFVALIPNNATFGTAPTFADISGMLLPFVHKHAASTAAPGGAPRAKL